MADDGLFVHVTLIEWQQDKVSLVECMEFPINEDTGLASTADFLGLINDVDLDSLEVWLTKDRQSTLSDECS